MSEAVVAADKMTTPEIHKSRKFQPPQIENTGLDKQQFLEHEDKDKLEQASSSEDLTSLHEAQENSDQEVQKDEAKDEPKADKNATANKILLAANVVSGAANLSAFIAEVLPALSSARSPLARLAEKGTKGFFIANGLINAIVRFKDKQILPLLGSVNQVVVGMFSPHNRAYLLKGPTVSLTQANNMINMITKKSDFKSWGENIKHLKNGVGKALEVLKQNPITAVQKSNSGYLGLLGSVLSTAGTLAWGVTGDEKLGTSIRDIGGGIIDCEQVMPYQWKNGRVNYGLSGALYLAGTAFDWLSKQAPQFEAPLRYLCFIFDSIGVLFQSVSENKGELSKNKQEVPDFKDTKPAATE